MEGENKFMQLFGRYNLLYVWSLSIYYRTQLDIRLKSYCNLNLLRASVLNLERLGILRISVGHPSKNLLSFEFAQSFCFQYRASRYSTGLNRILELKVLVPFVFNFTRMNWYEGNVCSFFFFCFFATVCIYLYTTYQFTST